MIGIIGVRRVIILLTLIAVNAVLGALLYMYLIPKQSEQERTLRRINNQVRAVQSDIKRMELEFEQLDQQQDSFDALKASGFFSSQERSDAKKLFNRIQNESQVASAVVNVKSGRIEDSPEAQKANYKVLVSPVEITVTAFDDADIYRYIDIAMDLMPGHLSLDEIQMQRTRDVTAAVLRSISSGASPDLVSADMKMSWRTLIPEDQVINGAGGGQER